MKEFIITSEADLFSTNLKNKISSQLFEKKKAYDFMDPRSIDDDALNNLLSLKKLIIKTFKKKFNTIWDQAYQGTDEFEDEPDCHARMNMAVAVYYVTYYNLSM
jgi:hypothetical protein